MTRNKVRELKDSLKTLTRQVCLMSDEELVATWKGIMPGVALVEPIDYQMLRMTLVWAMIDRIFPTDMALSGR